MKLLQKVQWLPFGIYLYPVITGFLVDSVKHDILGRYSTSWFTFSLLNLTLYPAFLWFHKKASLAGKSAVLGAMCLMTVLALNNLLMASSPYMALAWSLTRLAAGLSLLTISFNLFQLQKLRNSFAVFAVASLLVGFSVADVVMPNEAAKADFMRLAHPELECESGFANKFLALDEEFLALHPFATGDILIIGDSITQGLGLPDCAKAYPKVLRHLEDTKFTPPRTIHIMHVGEATIPQHITFLNLLPNSVKFDRIILQFRYALIPLDPIYTIPPPNKLSLKINDFVFMLGYGGYSLHMLSDALMPYFNNNAKFGNKYLQALHNIEAKSPTFERRLESLRQPLLRLNSLAAKHSQNPPIIIIFPFILPFENYAFEETNTALINLARDTNFVPLDLLPLYRASYKETYVNVVDPWHPDAELHATVAQYLAKILD